MKKKRIAVTGMGIVSCFGTDVEHFYQNLLSGRSGAVPIEEFPCQEYPTRFAAVIRNVDASAYIEKKQERRIDPFIRYILIAGKKALEQSHLVGADALNRLDLRRCGIIIGSGMGGMNSFYMGVETLLQKNFRRLSPFFVPYIISNMGGALLAIDLGFKGPNYSISTACATSNYCIQAAAEQIRQGNADLMLCGGGEAPITPIGLAGFVACRALSCRNEEPVRASRPWDQDRDGFVMGEGSGVLLLEDLEHALNRGAPILAEYLGGSVNCDAYHMTDPDKNGEGVAHCIQLALANAGVEKERVNYINAHATSTRMGDLCELEALRSFFGPLTKKMKINATKSMIGHCLGAAGGLEAIATLMAIRTSKLHPTLNLERPEPLLDEFDVVTSNPVEHSIDVALSNSFGFGGHNSTLVFAPYNK